MTALKDVPEITMRKERLSALLCLAACLCVVEAAVLARPKLATKGSSDCSSATGHAS